jgi:peptidyl-prolyl cis-trans isomerase C
VKVNLGFRTRIVAGVLAVLAVPVVVVGLTTLIAVKATSLPDGVALRVDGVDVTKAEVAKQSNVLTLLYGIQPPDNPAAFDRFRRSSAQTVALDRVLDRAAVEAGLGVSDKTAADALNQLLASGGALGPKNFGTALSASGVNQQDLLEEIKRQSLTQQLYQRVVEQAGAQRPVTDQEVQQFFDEHRSEMVRLETRHLRNILVADEATADKVLEQAKAGVDFAQLAQVDSIDSTTKGKGGDLGVLNRSILEDDYAAAAFSAAPGALFGPVKGSQGWNVGQVLEVTPAVPLNFPDVAEALRADIARRRVEDAWQAWAAERLEQAHVEYAGEYRPEAPESVPAAPQSR